MRNSVGLCWHEGCLCETRGVMISHHFIGTGVWSEALQRSWRDPVQLLAEVTGHVRACHLQVMATQAVPFDEGGLTLVWVLAESETSGPARLAGAADVRRWISTSVTTTAPRMPPTEPGRSGIVWRR